MKLGGNYCPRCLKPNGECTCFKDSLKSQPIESLSKDSTGPKDIQVLLDYALDCFCKVCGSKQCAERSVTCTEYKEFKYLLTNERVNG